MADLRDVDYLLKREAEERARADGCENPAVRLAHLELATRYADAAGIARGSGTSSRYS